MLPTLPVPYPDETVHSICSRLASRMGFSHHSIPQKLFNRRRLGSYVDLPYRLDILLSNFIHTPHLTVDKLIRNHTTAPFYVMFWHVDLVEKVLLEMGLAEANKTRVNRHSSTQAVPIGRPDYIMFCPVCAEEQRKQFGEAYWIRQHQVVDVKVCAVHQCFLSPTNILFKGDGSKIPDDSYGRKILPRSFYHPDDHIPDNRQPEYIDPDSTLHKTLLAYAEDVTWVLQNGDITQRRTMTIERVNLLMGMLGYGMHSLPDSNLRRLVAQISQKIHDKYSDDELEQLNIPKNSDWVMKSIPRKSKAYENHYNRCIRTWLIINSLETNLETLLSIPIKSQCESSSPYPCRSSKCLNYGIIGRYQHSCTNLSD